MATAAKSKRSSGLIVADVRFWPQTQWRRGEARRGGKRRRILAEVNSYPNRKEEVMRKRIIGFILLPALIAFTAVPASASDLPWPGSGFAEGVIYLDSFGASNATGVPGIHGGDVLSGDIAANLQYRGITDRGWLGDGLDTPGEACRGERQPTGSLWYVVQPLMPVEPPKGALSAGRSLIAKDDGDVHLEMEISAIVWDSKTDVGYRPKGRGSVRSRPGVLELTYRLTNVGERPVLDLRLYQYLHAHPNGSCFDVDEEGDPVPIGSGTPSHLASQINGAYDPKLYKEEHPWPTSQEYRFDLTFWAPDISEEVPGSTLGISALEPPSMWGMGDVGTVPVSGKPVPPGFCADNPDLIWCHIEADSLPSPKATRLGPGNIAGVLGWQLPRLNSGHSVERNVLLAFSLELPPE